MRENFELLAKITNWPGSFSPPNSFNSSADPESITKLIDHVISVFEKKEVTCVELNRSLERQQLELDASREQVNLASSRLKELRDRLNGSESQGIELNSKISTLTAQILTLEQALKREKSQATWSSEELAKTLDAFSSFRKEQSVLMAETRAQAEFAVSQAHETQQRLHRSLQGLKEREKQVSDLQEQVSHFKSQLMTNEANFTREMNSGSRMIELYKNASEEAAERISLLQMEIEDMREIVAQAEAQESGRAADLEAELEERQSVIKSKDEQLERMRIALDGLLKAAKTGLESSASAVDENSEVVSATEYAVCKGKLAKVEGECCQFRISMQEMANEVNSRAPLIESLQIDNSRLKGDVYILTEQLIKASAARDAAIGDRTELERNLAALQVEKESLQQECNDLSQQVQRLLVEIEGGIDDGSGKRLRRANSSSGDVLRASDIITENLVDFASVSHLQQRNQELLRSLRGISIKYEALEKEKQSPELRAQLEAALRELEEMHQARRRQAQMVETIIKTKPSSAETVAGANASNKAALTETMTVELEQIRRQLEGKQETLKKTISELEIVKRDLVDERVSKARLTSQFELNEERLKMLNETLQHERLEAASVRERISAQMESFNQAQSSSFKLMADLSAAQERESRLHAQIEKLQSEINSLLMETSRLQQETHSASGERDRLTSLLASMQGVLNEHESSEATLKRHFTTQVEFMERELEATRARVSEITASHSSALSALERDRSELLKRLEGLSEDLSQRKEINLRLEGNLVQANEKNLDLERVLQQAATESANDECNVRTYELRIRALSAELKNQQVSLQKSINRITELEEQLKELEETKMQFNSEREAVKQRENELKEAKTEIEHFKGDKERFEEEIGELKNQLATSRERIDELDKQIEELGNQIEARSKVISEIESEKNQLALQLDEAKNRCHTLDSSIAIGESERKHLMETVESLEDRLRSLKQQNDSLLDEAQKMSDESSSPDDLGHSGESGVIKFLRDEKDKLQIEKEKLVFDLRQSQLQAEEVQRILDIERAAVSAQSADYQRLLEEVQRMNSTRESGALQQHETSQMKMKISILESQLKEKNSALFPIKEALENAQSEIDQMKESLIILQSDRDSWKSRFETAISTASASASPLETELKQVKMQSEMFRQRAIALTKNLQETRSTAQKEIADLQKEVAELKDKFANCCPVIETTDVEMSHLPENEIKNEPELQAAEVETFVNVEPEIVEVSEVDEHEDEGEHEGEAEVDHEDEESSDDSIYEEISGPISESINESSIATDSVVASASTASLTVSESAMVALPVTETAADQQSPAPVAPARKKIVSLAGIVGSSTSSVTASNSSSSTSIPAMITTASGKKFIPVSFPDPPAASATNSVKKFTPVSFPDSSVASSAIAAPSAPSGSPRKAKKDKKPGLMKKKNKKLE